MVSYWTDQACLALLAYLWRPYPSVNRLSSPLSSPLATKIFNWSHNSCDRRHRRSSFWGQMWSDPSKRRIIDPGAGVDEWKQKGGIPPDFPQGLTPVFMWNWATVALPGCPRPHGGMFCVTPSSNLANPEQPMRWVMERRKHGERARKAWLPLPSVDPQTKITPDTWGYF